jgi:tellurite resistance protein TerC
MMVSSMVKVERHEFFFSFQDGFLNTVHAMFQKDNHYTLFRAEDLSAWVTFTAVFFVLIAFDNCVLHRNPRALTIGWACMYTLFWIGCACGFCGYVYYHWGREQAYMWMSGYIIEWLLSFDNLFVFHLIFNSYATPDHLKHRPLYLGICGAVFFRLLFIFIGEYLMHAVMFMHFVFGAFLVYTGIKTIAEDEDDEDPSQQPLVLWLKKRLPFISVYDEKGSFFVRVPVDERGEVDTSSLSNPEGGSQAGYGTVDLTPSANHGRRTELRATMLFLVLCCLEISDLLFAVDSVSAIVAQVNDLFLAYTSAIFAMLGLRATFFIIDVLARLFSLLKYGVAAVLVFIGVKLILSRMWHVPPGVVCLVLILMLGGSMAASVIQDRLQGAKKEKRSPLNSPVPKAKMMS